MVVRSVRTVGLKMGMMVVLLQMCNAMGTNDLGFPRTGPPRRACPPVARRDLDPLPPAEDTHTREGEGLGHCPLVFPFLRVPSRSLAATLPWVG
jgi:hypothetical protein